MKIEEGAHVRVTYEGTARNVRADEFQVAPFDVRQSCVRVVTRPPLIDSVRHVPVEIEVLALPTPAYERGAFYIDAAGDIYQLHRNGRWWGTPGDGWVIDYEVPVRPLRKLVPETS